MFVPSPYRGSNGLTETHDTAEFNYSNDHPSIAAALAAPRQNRSIYTVPKESTERDFMSNGIVNGVRKNTDYYTYRRAVSLPAVGYKKVQQYSNSPPKFIVWEWKPGVGYVGGSNTGIGSPDAQFKKRRTAGNTAGAANLALITNLENRCVTECLDKARNQKLDLSESLVDIDRSVLMVAKKVTQLVKAWEAARRRDWWGALKELVGPLRWKKSLWQRLKHWPGTVSAAWLEMYYGWLPLLNDIFAVAEVVKKGINLPNGIASAQRRGSQPLSFVEWAGDNAPEGWAEKSINASAQCDVKVKLRFRISNPTAAYLSAIGLDNPAYIVWVGTPFTFVIDWLLPIGTWLRALTAPMGLTFVDGYKSTRTYGSIDIECKHWGNYPSHDQPCKVGIQFLELSREAYPSFPFPLPYFRFPFSNPHRITSAIALLQQASKHR